jgi:hypothetical protein
MRASRVTVVLFALAAGCVDSCACGGGGGGDTQAAQGAAAGQGGANPATGTTAARGTAGAEAPAPAQPSWQPAPDSELTRQLAAAKAALDTEQSYEKLATDKSLHAALGDRLGELRAAGDVSSTVREDGQAKLAVAARNYKLADKDVRVKISDTGMLPNARRVVSNRLTLIGNAAVGNERGVFVRGYPAVVAHYPEQRVSRASVVLGNRYLVQVMVRNATEADDALRVIEHLDWTSVAPKQGKVPSPLPPQK